MILFKRAKNKIQYFIMSLLIFSIDVNGNAINNNPKKFLVYGGATGWIGGKIVLLLKEKNSVVIESKSRLESRENLKNEINEIKPDYVINAAGITGSPNIDWCEDHKQETIRANLIGALNLADVCYLYSIPMTNFGTGCIYQYDDKHPMYSGIGFKEEDEPNFDGSFYSKTKMMLDKLLLCYPNVLNLRIRMPISDDLHARSFVTKITKYAKVVNIPNSMSVLHDLLPVAIELTLREKKGVYNFVNPGVISHNEILDLYKEYIDKDFKYINFTLEDQNKILKSGRSNNELDCSKLLNEFPNIPNIKNSIIEVFKRMKINLSNKK